MSVLASTTKKVLGRVGVGQLTATGCHAANLAAAATLCAEAAAKGCCLLCLPEAFSFIGASAAETCAQAEPLVALGTAAPDQMQQGNAAEHALRSRMSVQFMLCGGAVGVAVHATGRS